MYDNLVVSEIRQFFLLFFLSFAESERRTFLYATLLYVCRHWYFVCQLVSAPRKVLLLLSNYKLTR